MSEKPDLPGDLLALAQEDILSAEALHEAERVSDSPVGFHAQQAVEKALKAALASRELEFPFTHDLGLLMQLCEDAGFKLPAELSEADRLTPYAAALRYGLGDPEAVPAETAIRWAETAFEWADGEVRPVEDDADGEQPDAA